MWQSRNAPTEVQGKATNRPPKGNRGEGFRMNIICFYQMTFFFRVSFEINIFMYQMKQNNSGGNLKIIFRGRSGLQIALKS